MRATDRRQVLTAAGGVLAAGLTGAIGGGNLADLATPTQVYRRAEATTASRLLRAPALAHMNLLRSLAAQAKTSASPVDHARLQVLIAETAGFCGWLALDCDETTAARQHYRLAVESAAQTNRPLLAVYMQASLAQFVSATDDHGNARRLAQRARTALPRNAPPIAKVWLDCTEAAILARDHDTTALGLLASAERHLTSVEPVWPWLQPFDAAKLDSYRHLVNIRLRRNPEQWATPAHSGRTVGPKQAASRLLERAGALVDLDQPERACAVAAAVFDTARHYQSESLTQGVIRFRTTVTATGTEVDNLDARLASMY